MALQFSTIGFINFNKEYNKILKSGSITVSFTASVKNQAGEYETQYFNGLIPAKLAQNAKEFINTKQLAKISGIASPAKKGHISFTILEIEQYQKEQKSDDFKNICHRETQSKEKQQNHFEVTDDMIPF